MSIYTQMINSFTRLFDDIQDIEIKNKLLISVLHAGKKVLQRTHNEHFKYKSIMQQDHINKTYQKPSLGASAGASIGTLVGGTFASLLSLTLPIVSSVATANAVSYYAQTNFKKNTARKIAALYNDNDIKNKFMNKVKETYFDNLERELKEIIDSYTYKCDKKTGSFIEKIEEAIDVENLIQVTGVFDELAHLTS